jgi:hypothetical protein
MQETPHREVLGVPTIGSQHSPESRDRDLVSSSAAASETSRSAF